LLVRLAASWWFSPGTPVSSTNKADRHDIAELLLKMALNTINLTNQPTNIIVSDLIRPGIEPAI
jgi:hypothetical protein